MLLSVSNVIKVSLACTTVTVQQASACTVEPPNKRDNINSAVVSFVERLSSFGGSKCSRTMGKQFGTLTCVLCREVYYIVSLRWRVHCTLSCPVIN